MQNSQPIDTSKDTTFVCKCGCKSQALFILFDDGTTEVNTRRDGRHRWMGTILSQKQARKLRIFLK